MSTRFWRMSLVLLIGFTTSETMAGSADFLVSACHPHRIEAPIEKYRAIHALCDSGPIGQRIAIRRFVSRGDAYLLLVDPNTLETTYELESCQRCQSVEEKAYQATRYGLALERLTASRGKIQDMGLTQAEIPMVGSFVTGDLCPSHHKMDRSFFESLMNAVVNLGPVRDSRDADFDPYKLQTMAVQVATSHAKVNSAPLALAISGAWIRQHRDDFEWLQKIERDGRLKILWVNHSYSHPFRQGLKIEENFLRLPGTDLEREVFETEKLLLLAGETPSVFFRFPGLVAESQLLKKLRRYGLVPLSSHAWLAKGQKPVDGSIILVHPNGNEPKGIKIFKTLLSKGQVPLPLHGLLEAIEPMRTPGKEVPADKISN